MRAAGAEAPSSPAIRLHAKQGDALESQATELLYGGAGGGGKSHLLRAAFVIWAAGIPGLQCYLFRRTYKELIRNHLDTPTGFMGLLSPWLRSGVAQFNKTDLRFDFANGSAIHLCHCQNAQDRDKYQGAEMHVLGLDEATQFPDDTYRWLRGWNRMSETVRANVPLEWRHLFPRMISCSNPGGSGHSAQKARFIAPAPPGSLHQAKDDDGGRVLQFIPAKLQDNPSLEPEEYARSLKGLGSPALVKAILEGDWDAVVGSYYGEVWDRERHVTKPFKIPDHWPRFRAHDWGSAKPSATYWIAIAQGQQPEGAPYLPIGSPVVYREWYTWTGEPNKGLRLKSEELGAGIAERSVGEVYGGCVADASIFTGDPDPSIYSRMARGAARWAAKNKEPNTFLFSKADNYPGSRINGWQAVYSLLKAGLADRPEEPWLCIFDTCTRLIDTLPTLVTDARKPDDIDTTQEDHPADALRYGLNSIFGPPVKAVEVDGSGIVLPESIAGALSGLEDLRIE